MISYILAIVISLLVIAVDQITKSYIASNYVLGGESHTFIKGIIDITYIHNSGGAWGMLSGYTWILISVTIVIMLICITMLLKVGLKNKLMFWAVCLVLSGGIGNMIDRIFRGGKVIDFFHFSFFKEFPVFNVADCAIVCGAALLLLYFIIDIIKDAKIKKVSNIEETKE
ncbi:MAG: signal peptidase II [Clostridia bacterium]|nr:signal peptidase II [Clostridia bacterium]